METSSAVWSCWGEFVIFFFFFFNCFMKESLEKCLQISLVMLCDCFVEKAMRLLVVMEKSFQCSVKHNPQDQISSLWTAETFNLFVMLSNSSHPKISLFCSPCLMALSEPNELDGLKILRGIVKLLCSLGWFYLYSLKLLLLVMLFFCWQSVYFLPLKQYDVIVL